MRRDHHSPPQYNLYMFRRGDGDSILQLFSARTVLFFTSTTPKDGSNRKEDCEYCEDARGDYHPDRQHSRILAERPCSVEN